MAKFYGSIGFTIGVESEPGSGVITQSEETRKYAGDMLRMSYSYSQGDSRNDNFNVTNQISIVADSFLLNNTHAIRWVEILGHKWKVENVTISYPRLILSIGGVYIDEQGTSVVSTESVEGAS